MGENEYYEQVLRVITMLDTPGIKGMRLSGQKWYEIDDEQDLDIATTLLLQMMRQELTLCIKIWRILEISGIVGFLLSC